MSARRGGIAAALGCALALGCGSAARADQAGYLYTYGVYDQRYDDAVSALDLYKPLGTPGAALRPYVALYATRDSRTSGGFGGVLPLIYGDNYILGAGGVQYTRPSGLRLFAQIGASAPLGTVPATRSGFDYRFGAQLYREWTAARDRRDYGNLYGSLSYLSRYDDAILYAQYESGRHFGSLAHPIDLYGRAVLTLDSHTYYYDSLAEIVGGVRFHPFGLRGPSIALEETGGRYLRGVLPEGQRASYADFRPTIAFGVNL